ncbi:MAG: hypothetical protein C4306_01780 [Thermoleophilia bacterium]
MSPSMPAGSALSARPGRAGAGVSLGTRIIVATGVLALLSAAAFAVLLLALLDMRAAASREARAKDVTVATLALEKLVLDLETGVRGFVLTGDPRLLQPWEKARKAIPARLESLAQLLRGHPQELRRLRSLREAIRAYEEDYSTPLVRIAERSPAAARTPLASSEGERRMAAVRGAFARFLREENARAATLAATAQRESARALWLAVAALAAAAFLLLAFAFYLTRSIARPVREAAEGASRVAAGDLSARLRETGPGEVGELTIAFNAMTASLVESRRALETHVAQQRAVAELSRLALAETDHDSLLQAAAQAIADTLGVEYAGIWELAPDEQALLLVSGVGWSRQPLRVSLTLLESEAGEGESGPAPRSLLAEYGAPSGLAVPVPEPGRPLAALGAFASQPRVFSHDEELFLQAVASLLAASLSRRRLEESLRQAQKMEAIGRLAGGIAHDFNNILLAIKAEAWLLSAQLAPEAKERELVQAIDDAAERASTLVRHLLAFSREQSWQRELLDPSAVVASLAEMLEPLIGEDVELELELDRDPGLVHMDRAQLEQVVMNLVVNARDAMPGGGRVTVAVRPVRAFAEGGQAEPAGFVVIEVTDTGVGIAPEDQARIFEPFFTSKSDGSGLGLAIVHGIVTRMGGRIEVRSAPGSGATFSVYLPRSPEPAPAVMSPRRRGLPGRGRETILVVEDEEMVREPVAAILEQHGYRVLAASGAAEALRLTDQGEQPIDLLVTDVVMPDLSGPELARVFQRIQPGLKVIYVSGYPERAAAFAGLSEALARERAPLLRKPFAPEALLAEIRELLDRESPGQASPQASRAGRSRLAR